MPEPIDDLPYDKSNPSDIERYARELIGRKFVDIISSDREEDKVAGLKGNKGYLGQFLERFYFHYEPNSSKDPDFLEAGVELKVSPLKELKNGELRAKERIVLNIIDFLTIVEEEWEKSSFLYKNELLLLVFYLYELEKKDDRLDFEIKMATLWDYGDGDLEIIKEDWHKIVNKIRAGKAHELSERDTLYLGACPKGSSCESVRKQPFSDEPAMQRALCLKNSYVSSIVSRIEDADSVDRTLDDFKNAKTFEDIVMERVSKYHGVDIDTIHSELGDGLNRNAKNYYASLASRMLGLKKDKIEEFEKADVEVRVTRLHSDGKPAESLSFPYFKYKEIINESWEDSKLLNKLDKRFFFMVLQYDKRKTKKEEGKGILRFKKGMFWAIPDDDLKEVRSVWEETIRRIKDGRADDLPKISENGVSHVRPHATKNNTCETPQGEHLIKKSFWLNAAYLGEQVKDD